MSPISHVPHSDTSAPGTAGPPPDSAQPIAARIPDACRLSGLSRSALYRGWRDGRIAFRKLGRTTLVLMDSVRAYLAALPEAKPRHRHNPPA